MKTSNMNGVVILQACTSSCEQLDRKCCRRPANLDLEGTLCAFTSFDHPVVVLVFLCILLSSLIRALQW